MHDDGHHGRRLLLSWKPPDDHPTLCTISIRYASLSRVGKAVRNACSAAENSSRTDPVVFTRFSDDRNRSTVLSMNGAHKMIIFDNRREIDGFVDLKIVRRGQLGVCEFLCESPNVTSMENPIRFHKCAWILLRTILQCCNDSMIKKQVCLCSKVLVMVQESVRFLR